MNIFKQEIRFYWKSLLFWGLGIGVLIVGGFSKYEGLAKAGKESLDQLLSVLPEQLLAIFGGREADLTNILNYYALFFLYFAILAAIHAGLLGAGILAKEEQDKTTEFLYVKPRSRSYIITQKLLAAFALVLGLNLIIFTLSAVFAGIFNINDNVITAEIATTMLGLLFIQLIFLGAGMMFAALVRNPKLAAPLVAAVVMSTFLLSILIDIVADLQDLKYFTPFKYFDAKVIVKENALDPVFIAISIAIIIVTISATYFFYTRRDLEV